MCHCILGGLAGQLNSGEGTGMRHYTSILSKSGNTYWNSLQHLLHAKSVVLVVVSYLRPQYSSQWDISFPMLNLSDTQLATLKAVQDILNNAGLSPLNLNTNLPPSHNASPATPSMSVQQPVNLSPEVIAAHYHPPPARLFTTDEVARCCNKINHETSVDAIIEHHLSAIVEYPQTGSVPGLAVAHIFYINPNPHLFIHPKSNL